MASTDPVKWVPLTRTQAEAAASEVNEEQPLSLAGLWLDLGTTDKEPPKRCLGIVFLVLVREGGFMLLMPQGEDFMNKVESINENLSSEPAFSHGEVALVTVRSRAIGTVGATLVDLPWSALPYLSKATVLRGAAAKQVQQIGFEKDGTAGRPTSRSALDFANQWLSGDLDAQTAEEYATGVEGHLGDEELGADPESSDVKISALQDKLAQMEKELNAARAAASVHSTAAVAPGRGSGTLFAGQEGTLTDADMVKLQRLAGPPPVRGCGATPKKKASVTHHVPDGVLAEVEKEAISAEEGLALPSVNEVTDPVQRMLLFQMQQNALLMQRLHQPRDAMTSLLGGGSGSESGSSSTGARGCLARDLFMKAMQDLPRVSETVRNNALTELGMPAAKEDGFLMRKYLERRVPLGDHKLLAHVGALVSEGWAIAYLSDNIEMMGFLGRFMLFIEQCALDNGKIDLAWLMTGFAEPSHHLNFPLKKTPGLKPFSRLASPLWVSANLAYLRDLDFLESRMASVGKPKGKALGDSEEVVDPNPKRRPKPKKQPKGGGKDSKEDGAV